MLNCNLRFSSAMETVACSRYAPVAYIPSNFQHSRIIKSLKLCKLPGGLFKRNVSKRHRLRYRPLVASAKGHLKGDPDEETRKPYLVDENDSTAVQFNEHPLAFGSSISSMEPLIDDGCLFEEESVGEKRGRDLAVIKTKPSSVIQIPGLPDGNNASSITSGSWEWKHKWIVNYEKAGSQNVGAPAVLFLPGFGVGSFHYENQLRDLGRNFRVWSVDFLGQGRSLPCEDPAPPVGEADSEENIKYWGFGPQAEPWASELVYSVDLWRDQIRNFVEQVIGEPIYVVGNSLGGFVGLYFAACYPQLVRGITLLNATPFWAFIPNSSRSPNMAKLFPWAGNFPVPPITRKLIEFFWSKISQPEAIKNVLKQVYVDHSAMTDELLLRILEATEHPAAAASFASIIFAPQGELSFNETLLRCQEMNIPICLIYGREDPWVRPQWGQLVKKQVPDAVYYEISPAGHCPHSEVPEVVNFLLRGWIENRESQASVALPLYDDPSLLHLDLWREIEFERKGLRRSVQVRVVRSKSLFWKNWKNLLSVFQPLLRIFGGKSHKTRI